LLQHVLLAPKPNWGTSDHVLTLQIPLGPKDVRANQHILASLPFSQATSSWPNRFIRDNAREVLVQSVASHLRAMGWDLEGKEGELVPA
jgi:hypothetical protein